MLSIDLKGKHAFVAGVGDDVGFGWAIAKALFQAGAKVSIGTWTPVVKIFEQSWKTGKFDESRKLPDGSLFEIAGVFPLDASYDKPEDIPQEVREHRRYADFSRYSISEVAQDVSEKIGPVDILIHSLANAPEIKNDLLDTSREGYIAAVSSSSYSLISLVKHFGPYMKQGSSVVSLTFLAGQKTIPGYGGGMSSAKAALENDTRMLAWEAGRKWGLRVNTISSGPMVTRAAKAIGIIDLMVEYSLNNAPLQQSVEGQDIASLATFLSSDLARCMTGGTIFVDNGLHSMGIAPQLTTHPLA
jgi:enoyl-[acyl-carrier protein] reductase I